MPAWEAGSVGARIESVLEAAERVAAGIRQDAEERAHRYLEESRQKADEMAAERLHELSSLTDDLITRARTVAQRSQELIAALEDAGRRVAEGSSQSPAAPLRSASEPPLSSVETSPPPVPAAERPEPEPVPPGLRPSSPKGAGVPAGPGSAGRPKSLSGNSAVSEGARLLATQMAVAGSSREKIASRLQEEFGIQDPRPILDEIGI
jgi:vacuolar-type H+-ATPase subunit H